MVFEVVGALAVAALVLWLVFEPFAQASDPAFSLLEPPAPEETPRGAALLALKEIEFDRETGKLSPEDYEMLKARWSAEALQAMAAEDSMIRAEAVAGDPEALIASQKQRLRSARESGAAEPPLCADCGPRPEPDARFCSSCGRGIGTAFCPSCGAPLTSENRFCSGCGHAVAA
jgi:hypothetical protein